jgi:putative SOS response-associated peptidase YedK
VCGRYTLTTRRSDEIQAKLADTLGVETPSSDCGFERFNIAPMHGQVVPSSTIITCEANELVRPIHDRMPVVFADPGLWHSWLHPSRRRGRARAARALTRADGMAGRPASPVVNSPRDERPDCLAASAGA